MCLLPELHLGRTDSCSTMIPEELVVFSKFVGMAVDPGVHRLPNAVDA